MIGEKEAVNTASFPPLYLVSPFFPIRWMQFALDTMSIRRHHEKTCYCTPHIVCYNLSGSEISPFLTHQIQEALKRTGKNVEQKGDCI